MAVTVDFRKCVVTLAFTAAVGCTLAGCLGPLSYRPPKPKEVATAPVAAAKQVPLPPIPDPKVNNATLAGIDTTGMGIRDDVHVWIYTNYSSAKKRGALTQVAKALQAVMAKNPRTAEEAGKLQQSFNDAMLSLKGIPGLDPREPDKMDYSLYELIVNTPERSKAYLRYSLMQGK